MSSRRNGKILWVGMGLEGPDLLGRRQRHCTTAVGRLAGLDSDRPPEGPAELDTTQPAYGGHLLASSRLGPTGLSSEQLEGSAGIRDSWARLTSESRSAVRDALRSSSFSPCPRSVSISVSSLCVRAKCAAGGMDGQCWKLHFTGLDHREGTCVGPERGGPGQQGRAGGRSGPSKGGRDSKQP